MSETKNKSRISSSTHENIGGYNFYIVEVDGVEYITQPCKGAITPLVKNEASQKNLLVIFEQIYDLVNIYDIIEQDKLSAYIKHFNQQVIKKQNVISITETKHQPESGSYSVRTHTRHINSDGSELNDFGWDHGFEYIKFDGVNNFKNLNL